MSTDTPKIKKFEMIFRPIEPEDAKKWYTFILSCSKHSIYSRYQHAVEFNKDQIEQYCKVDSEKEIAYVAEVQDFFNGMKIVAEVRLFVFEHNPNEAEFAILVADAYQGKGIGQVITKEIIAIGKERGIKKIIAYTDNDNKKMLQVFKKLGFDKRSTFLSQTVDLEKLL